MIIGIIILNPEEIFLGNEYDFSYSNCFHILENRKQKFFTTEKLKSGKIFHFLAKKYLVKISTLILRKKIFDQESKFVALILLETLNTL